MGRVLGTILMAILVVPRLVMAPLKIQRNRKSSKTCKTSGYQVV